MPTGSARVLTAHGQAASLARLAPGQAVSVKTEVPVDHATVALQTKPSAAGVMSCVLPPADVGYALRIERIGVNVAGSANPTTCTVYVGPADPQNQADYTPAGNQDQADENNPILVPGGQPLTIVWTGATDGAIGFARVQFTTVVIVRGQVAPGSAG